MAFPFVIGVIGRALLGGGRAGGLANLLGGSAPTVSLTVEIKGATEAVARLGRQAAMLRDRRVPNRQLGIQLYGWVIRNFDRAGAMQSPTWAPLAESTIRQKQRLGYSLQPLIRTGNLRQSFAPFSDNEQAGVGARASFGVDYAEVHQDGSDRVPARPMLPPPATALDFATKVYELYVAKVVKLP